MTFPNAEISEQLQGLYQRLAQAETRIEDLEDEHDSLTNLLQTVGELAGKVETLQTLIMAKLEGVGASVDKATSTRTALEFAAVVIIPVVVAIIGGYFALRAGLASHPPPSK